jgi:hypothetical protein
MDNEAETICLTCGAQLLDQEHLDWCGMKVKEKLSSNGQHGEWESPVPLVGASCLPAFPADTLPDPLGTYAIELAHATQTPVDLPGVMILGALATAAGGRVVVEVRSGWREPTNLFLGIAMAPGNRKSAVAQAVTEPLHGAEEEAIEGVRQEIREAQVQRDIAEQRAKAAIRKAQSLADDAPDPAVAEREAQELVALADQIEVRAMPQLLADDATPEALASLMYEQGGRIALISAEGGPFDMMAGRYSRGEPNLDVYLKGHAGDHLRVNRQGRAAQIIKRPALTTAVAFQPGILPKIAAGEGFRARGLIARFLFSVPRSFVGYRQIGAEPVNGETAVKYGDLVRRLVLTLDGWGTDPWCSGSPRKLTTGFRRTSAGSNRASLRALPWACWRIGARSSPVLLLASPGCCISPAPRISRPGIASPSPKTRCSRRSASASTS